VLLLIEVSRTKVVLVGIAAGVFVANRSWLSVESWKRRLRGTLQR
jgi:hypothetical protein